MCSFSHSPFSQPMSFSFLNFLFPRHHVPRDPGPPRTYILYTRAALPIIKIKRTRPLSASVACAPCYSALLLGRWPMAASCIHGCIARFSVFAISIPRLMTHAGVVASSRLMRRDLHSVCFSSALHTAARPGPRPRQRVWSAVDMGDRATFKATQEGDALGLLGRLLGPGYF